MWSRVEAPFELLMQRFRETRVEGHRRDLERQVPENEGLEVSVIVQPVPGCVAPEL